jgi:hypothetical protein
MGKPESSVAEALGRAHTALLQDLGQLEEMVRPASGASLPELRARLGATRADVIEHFRFEEHNGYMDAVRKREPRLERMIHELAEEHRQLTQSLDALVTTASAAPQLEDTLRTQVRGWVASVRLHEVRDNDLVQDAFNYDIAAED